jgi:hypothetical protein
VALDVRCWSVVVGFADAKTLVETPRLQKELRDLLDAMFSTRFKQPMRHDSMVV